MRRISVLLVTLSALLGSSWLAAPATARIDVSNVLRIDESARCSQPPTDVVEAPAGPAVAITDWDAFILLKDDDEVLVSTSESARCDLPLSPRRWARIDVSDILRIDE